MGLKLLVLPVFPWTTCLSSVESAPQMFSALRFAIVVVIVLVVIVVVSAVGLAYFWPVSTLPMRPVLMRLVLIGRVIAVSVRILSVCGVGHIEESEKGEELHW